MVSQTLSIQHVGLWSNLVKVFSEEVSPLRLQRKFVRTVWRWMDVYLRDLPPDLVSFAVKCYYGHRGIPTALDQLVDDLKRFNQRADVVKLGKLIKDAEKRDEEKRRSMVCSRGCRSGFRQVRRSGSEEEKFDGFGLHEVVSYELVMLSNTISG